ncbi:MAG: PRC-barrel domain-containing protein [Candidatus Marsarchaeota archaeon]|jgi:sporulation protein YlmC with PRC-barrel domain|nr:PRC-barrel domain-containing protein [Candidatus Marsarchaeota archaeon]MCL5112818.1 PRC-barrel domain-containing protein [Candidatus Marsarchaeota archaeon]
MVKFIIAKQLVGKKVITVDGFDLGRLLDAEVSETTGKINFLLIEPNPDSSIASKIKQDSGQIRVPYSAVVAVNDFMMIDRKHI